MRIVLDLSFLRCRTAEDLAVDLRGAEVLITFELVYELMTMSRGRGRNPPAPRNLLDKLAGLTLVQSYPIVNLVNWEREREEPMLSVVDDAGTKALPRFVEGGQGVRVSSEVEESVRRFYEEDEPQRLREGLQQMWPSKYDEVFRVARNAIADGTSSAGAYVTLFGRLPDKTVGEVTAAERRMRELPTSDWVMFWYDRLRNFLAFRYRLNGMRPDGLASKTVANDLLDLHYVCFLSRADGIATADMKLIRPTAEAFFSNKRMVLPS